MKRTEKQQLIDELHQEFGKSPHAILVDFRGSRSRRSPSSGARCADRARAIAW